MFSMGTKQLQNIQTLSKSKLFPKIMDLMKQSNCKCCLSQSLLVLAYWKPEKVKQVVRLIQIIKVLFYR